MRTETQEIDIESLHIYRQVRDALCRIEQNDRTGSMGLGNHLLSRIDGAQHVGHLCEGYEFRLLLQELLVDIQAQQPFVGDRYKFQAGACALSQQLPGNEVAMM